MARKMKDSGVEWIGLIPEEWNIKKVKHCFVRKNEKAEQEEPIILSLARSGVKVRDISSGEGQIAESYYNYNPVSVGDLLLNPMDLYSGANCSVSKVEGVISPAYMNLGAKDDNDSSYYDYYFKTQYWGMTLFAHGKGVSYDNRWTLNAETLFNYYLPVPSVYEQKKIADFLDEKVGKIDAFILRTKQSINEYKKYKKAVITEAVTRGIDDAILTKDSGIEWIGKIPKHWTLRKVKSYTDMISKGTTPKDMSTVKTDEYRIRYLKSENIVDSKLVLLPEFYITDEVNDSLERSKLSEKDIMFVIAGASIGKVAMMNSDLLPANTNQAMAFLRIKEEYFGLSKYIWYFLQSNIVSSVIALYSVQSAQPNLSMENLGNIRMPLSTNDSEVYKIVTNVYNYARKLVRRLII